MRTRHLGKICLVLAAIAASISCNRGRTESASGIDSDTLAIDDTTACDSILTDEQEDEGLSFENRSTEVFGDFIFAFTHNTRFQAERIRFPLPVTDIDGTERTIKSGRQFRSEFRLPHNDYYTLLLGDQRQLDIVQSDTALVNVSLQIIRLHQLTMDCYNFQRSEGRIACPATSGGFLPFLRPVLDGYYISAGEPCPTTEIYHG